MRVRKSGFFSLIELERSEDYVKREDKCVCVRGKPQNKETLVMRDCVRFYVERKRERLGQN